MTIRASILFAKRLIFPLTKKHSAARRSLSASLLCIGISLVPLVVVLTVSNGMIQGMTDRIIGLSSSHLQAVIYNSSEYINSEESLNLISEKIKKIDGVISAYPEINVASLAASTTFRCGVQVRSISPDIFLKNKSFAEFFEFLEGDLSSFKSDSKTAIIGKNIAEQLNIKVGDTFRLISASSSPDGKIIPKTSALKVAAIVSSGYQELDAAWVFVSLSTGFEIIRKGTGVYSILIETNNAFSPELLNIQSLCENELSFNADIYRWDELNKSQYENFSSTKVMLIFIMLLIVLVASINISSSLVMLVMEKRREIAILKSLGGTSSGISLAFIITGVSSGIGGVIIGLPLGLLCAVNVNYIISFLERIVNFGAQFIYALLGYDFTNLSHINLMDPSYYLTSVPIVIPFFDLSMIVVSTIILSLIVSVIPAYKAGSEKPLETLRKV